METERWRIELIREAEVLPAPWRPPGRHEAPPPPVGESAVAALLEAVELLTRRGPGAQAWTVPFRHDPIAFLLDSISDAINLWGPGGKLLYQNGVAARLGVGRCQEEPLEVFASSGRRFERRCMRCRFGDREAILEIIRQV
jgi:hypothetical protein